MSARIFSKILRGLAVTALGVASYWSIRLAYADMLFRENTAASVERAVELDAANARYRAWLAEIQEYEGRDPSAALETASILNPSDSAIWIRRGLRAESRSDFANAEEFLLHGAAIDKLYAPRWALANYYARRGDLERFWPWVRSALEIGYDDLTSVFRLCWSLSSDAELIRSQAIPPQSSVLRKYLAFLTREDHLDAAVPVARSILSQAGPTDTPVLLDYCDRLIEKKQTSSALGIWNALSQRRLIPFTPLDPVLGLAITNGAFQSELLQRGFDWRLSAEPEISAARSSSPPALRFRLSGKQPEHCELLSQFIPLAHGTYRLGFEYKTSLGSRSGLRLIVGDLARSSELNGAEWEQAQVIFRSDRPSLARLRLVYERESGAARAEGEIWLRNATIGLEK